MEVELKPAVLRKGTAIPHLPGVEGGAQTETGLCPFSPHLFHPGGLSAYTDLSPPRNGEPAW